MFQETSITFHSKHYYKRCRTDAFSTGVKTGSDVADVLGKLVPDRGCRDDESAVANRRTSGSRQKNVCGGDVLHVAYFSAVIIVR